MQGERERRRGRRKGEESGVSSSLIVPLVCPRMDGWMDAQYTINRSHPQPCPSIHPSMGKQQQSQSLHYTGVASDPSFWKNHHHHHSSLLFLAPLSLPYLQVAFLSFHLCLVFSHSIALLPNVQSPINIFVGSNGDTWLFFYPFLPFPFLTYLLSLFSYSICNPSFLSFLCTH
ncbi:hypothetical protein HOY82DRAFT_318399 [Tuber indicum]|nr:hypothetical protein HOY82DRAFT_318399 [Tuber indicum]